MTAPALLEARHLSIRLDGHAVLSDITLALHRAEIVTILGPNGSGKSTLLRALLGILPPHAGQVTRQPGLVIGYVPQRLAIDRTLPDYAELDQLMRVS